MLHRVLLFSDEEEYGNEQADYRAMGDNKVSYVSTHEEEKKTQRKKNPHNRAPVSSDKKDSDFGCRFLEQVDTSETDRDKYYSSLEHDMDAMRNRLKDIEKWKGGINICMIAEKPKVAEVISQVLSNNEQQSIRDGGFTRHEYNGNFLGVRACFRVLSVFGHIYQ